MDGWMNDWMDGQPGTGRHTGRQTDFEFKPNCVQLSSVTIVNQVVIVNMFFKPIGRLLFTSLLFFKKYQFHCIILQLLYTFL